MGNAAIGLGAIARAWALCPATPGTPSTEVLETIAKARPGDVYVEWSVNERSRFEVAAGARVHRQARAGDDEAGRPERSLRTR